MGSVLDMAGEKVDKMANRIIYEAAAVRQYVKLEKEGDIGVRLKRFGYADIMYSTALEKVYIAEEKLMAEGKGEAVERIGRKMDSYLPGQVGSLRELDLARRRALTIISDPDSILNDWLGEALPSLRRHEELAGLRRSMGESQLSVANARFESPRFLYEERERLGSDIKFLDATCGAGPDGRALPLKEFDRRIMKVLYQAMKKGVSYIAISEENRRDVIRLSTGILDTKMGNVTFIPVWYSSELP